MSERSIKVGRLVIIYFNSCLPLSNRSIEFDCVCSNELRKYLHEQSEPHLSLRYMMKFSHFTGAEKYLNLLLRNIFIAMMVLSRDQIKTKGKKPS